MTAATVTISDVLGKIKKTEHLILPDGRTTLCMLTLENGYTIRGESSCVCIENFNVALGEKYAFEDAVKKIWPLEGYLLKQKLYDDAHGTTNAHVDEQLAWHGALEARLMGLLVIDDPEMIDEVVEALVLQSNKL